MKSRQKTKVEEKQNPCSQNLCFCFSESIKISTLAERSNNFREKKKVERKINFQYCFENEFEFYSIEGADGKPLSSEEFITKIYGVLPDLFKNEEELRKIWSNPITRKEFLKRLFDLGIDLEQLDNIQKVVNAEDCDLFDVLSYLSYNTPLITRQQRIANSKENIFEGVDDKNKEFLNFVLSKYEEKGVEELDEEKLPQLLNLKYNAISDAINILGEVDSIRSTFFDFQEHLYAKV